MRALFFILAALVAGVLGLSACSSSNAHGIRGDSAKDSDVKRALYCFTLNNQSGMPLAKDPSGLVAMIWETEEGQASGPPDGALDAGESQEICAGIRLDGHALNKEAGANIQLLDGNQKKIFTVRIDAEWTSTSGDYTWMDLKLYDASGSTVQTLHSPHHVYEGDPVWDSVIYDNARIFDPTSDLVIPEPS